jgi:hypothetical protein
VHPVRHVAALVLLLAGEVASVGALVRLGSREPFTVPLDDLPAWLRAADPSAAVAACVRVLALAAAGWLLATTLLYLVARLSLIARLAPSPTALHTIQWVVLPVVRRVVDRAVVLVAAGAFAAPAVAASVDPPSSLPTVRDGHAVTVSATAPAPAFSTPATVVAGTPPNVVVPVVAASSTASSEATTATVARDDNLWDLSAARLAAGTGRLRAELDNGEIARYWIRVCDANRGRVRSGDVDVIYPGEVIVLPPIS